MANAKYIILLSGKRKCGKDYLAEQLNKRFNERSQIVRISEPIKSEWAKKLNLDLEQLLSDGPYKEKYRKEMIEWSDTVRADDYGYFCRSAMQNADHEIIIVSDIRRKSDVKFFKETYGDKIVTIRITCPEIIRAERGWIYQLGVDDVPSECDLDDYEQWDLVIENNGSLKGDLLVDLIFTKFNFE